MLTARVSVETEGAVVDAEAEIETDGNKKRMHSASPDPRKLRKCNSADRVHNGMQLFLKMSTKTLIV